MNESILQAILEKLTNLEAASAEIKVIRMPELEEKTGLNRVTIYRMVKEGEFPRQREISSRNVGWLSTDVDQWLINRPVAGTPELTQGGK